MIRNSHARRLGDAAADNISTAVFGSAGFAAVSGQGSLVNNVAGQLSAQGIDPSTATPAQIRAVYNQGQQAILAQLEAGSVNPVLPPPPAPAPGLVSTPGPALNMPSYIPAPQLPSIAPAAVSPLSAIEGLPTWAYVAGAVALGLLFFGGGRR